MSTQQQNANKKLKKSPSIHTPVAKSPSIHTPVAKSPSIHTPVAKSPSIHTPVANITQEPQYLVIVESPSKCNKIEQFLNKNTATCGAKVISTRGHLYEISCLKDINMKDGNFDIKYSILKEKEKYVVELRKQIKKGGYFKIILASDDDREGEFIAWTICDLFQLPVETTPRIIFHEITESAIINAFITPQTINMNLVNAQKCRTILDLLIGYKISPTLWKNIASTPNITLSAGRCQTPALRLIYDAHLLSKNEEPIYQYKTTAIFANLLPLNFSLYPPLALPTDNNREHNIGKFIKQFIDNEIACPHYLTIEETKQSKHEAPQPLNTSSLLQQASSILKMSPKQTMQLAQQLYQEGHITYMRTECRILSESFKNQAQQFILNKYGEPYLKTDDNVKQSLISNDGKNDGKNNMPHEAIRCTHVETGGNIGDTDAKGKLYKLIWKHSVYTMMSDEVLNVTKLKINTHEPATYIWQTEIQIPVFNGWKILGNCEKIDNIQSVNLSTYNKYKNVVLPINNLEITNEIKCKKNGHYTESGLIKKLEEIGIGRPSTFQSIVETIKDRNYIAVGNIEGISYESISYIYKITDACPKTETNIKKMGEEKNKLIITEQGLKVCEFLTNNFESLFNYNYTSQMEILLDKIADPNTSTNTSEVPLDKLGRINQRTICNDCLSEIKSCISKINTTPVAFETQDGKKYEMYYSQKGPLIRDKETKEIYNIKHQHKDNCDIEMAIKKCTILSDIAEIPLLGYYKELPVYAKVGKYGPFIQWGEKNISVKTINNITLENIIVLLDPPTLTITTDELKLLPENKKILRNINREISIRKGKYAQPYIYYKKSGDNTPEFISLKGTSKMWWKTCSVNEFIEWFNGAN